MINLTMHTQPDDESCGATSLYAIYRYYDFDISLPEVIGAVERSISGGTLAPMLGQHALQMGFEARLYINNLDIFDPSWFTHEHGDKTLLQNKLRAQLRYKNTPNMHQVSNAYQQYLELGGEICFKTLNVQLLKDYFDQKTPILTGLSATYLYRSQREYYSREGLASYDDVKGTPCGHFVVLCGYNDKHRLVVVADPHRENPLSHNNYYEVSSSRLINAIMLGVLTNDANLLIIKPRTLYGNRDCHE